MDEAFLSAARNFRRVNDLLCTAGQPTESQLASAASDGVRVVVNLALHDDPRYSLVNERQSVESLGMIYVYIPVDFAAPRSRDLQAFFDAMDAHAGDHVLLHCAANYRATAFLGLYRALRQAWSPDDAFELMHTVWEPNETWAQFIADALARYRG